MEVIKNSVKAIITMKLSPKEPIMVDTRDTTIIRVTDTRMAAYASVHFPRFIMPLSYSLA